MTSGTGFYTLAPCRVIDTRRAVGQWGGPSLAGGSVRHFTVAGQCGVPASARAVSANVTVVPHGTGGYLTIFPSDVSQPTASSVSFSGNRTRANNLLVKLSSDGTGSIAIHNVSTGNVDVILDVSGSFR